jgi:hypothetical protein
MKSQWGNDGNICFAEEEEEEEEEESDFGVTGESVMDIIAICIQHFKQETVKNDVFWGVTPCGSCKSRRFGGT